MNAPPEVPHTYRFGVYEVDLLAHELRRHGVRIRLQEQPYQILLLLLERAGKVVTRDELRQRIWPSSVFIDFDHGLNNAIARLREALGDTASKPQFIETTQRVGYRFLETVTTLMHEAVPAAVNVPPSETDSKPPGAVRWSRGRWLVLASSVAAALLIAALSIMRLSDHWPTDRQASAVVAPAPSIAVLPFANMSSDDENEHFADGLTEELVNKLAGISGLKVVARTSSFRFKDTKESAATIAQALQVNHFLEGSVRRTGTRLRITAQLIDARKDEHVWSKTFDREIGDIFQIQEEIAFAVALALKVSLLDADETRIRKRGTSDPEAYRLYLVARSHLLRLARPSDPELAKRSLDTAIELDPSFALAHAAIARYHFGRAWTTLADTEESSKFGLAAAERAIALDPTLSEAFQARANFGFWRYRFAGEYAAHVAARRDMQKAIELDPTNSKALEEFGRAMLWHEPAFAASLFEQAIQVDQNFTEPHIWMSSLLASRGEVEAARRRCVELLERVPDAIPCRMAIATVETYFGHLEQAVALLKANEQAIGGAARIQLWSVLMSLGDRGGALQFLDFGTKPFEKTLSTAARLAMDGRYDQAYGVLDGSRKEYPFSRLLDLPTAKFALLAGKPKEARAILELRLPDLVSGIEPISARNLLPALDLATAQLSSRADDDPYALLGRIAAYLDGTEALRLPMFAFQRARAHALAGETDKALRALDRAYDEGLRTTWALDLRPQSMLYVDPIEADPAFDALRDDTRFRQWLGRIKADNSRQLEQMRKALAASDAG